MRVTGAAAASFADVAPKALPPYAPRFRRLSQNQGTVGSLILYESFGCCIFSMIFASCKTDDHFLYIESQYTKNLPKQRAIAI